MSEPIFTKKNKSSNRLLKICLSVRQWKGEEGLVTYMRILQGQGRAGLCAGHTHCLAGTVNFQCLCPQRTQDHFVKISIGAKFFRSSATMGWAWGVKIVGGRGYSHTELLYGIYG